MVVNDRRVVRRSEMFGDIPLGELFIKDDSDTVYIKIPYCQQNEFEIFNAYCFNKEEFVYFSLYDVVFPIEASLNILNYK